MNKSIYVEKSYNTMRIDRFIRSHLGNMPQGLIEKNLRNGTFKPVSYTHLTLPTICSV